MLSIDNKAGLTQLRCSVRPDHYDLHAGGELLQPDDCLVVGIVPIGFIAVYFNGHVVLIA